MLNKFNAPVCPKNPSVLQCIFFFKELNFAYKLCYNHVITIVAFKLLSAEQKYVHIRCGWHKG